MMTAGLVFCIFIVFYFALLEGGHLYTGRHRGEYVEKLEWKPSPWKQLPGGMLLWDGSCTIANVVTQNDVATMTITPDGGLLTLPALSGQPGPPDVPGEEEIREFINHELCSTPIFTGLKYGGFGDSDFDMADSTPLCVPLPDRLSESVLIL